MLASYPLQKQANIVMNSIGLISTTGAGFCWQFWLEPMSPLLIVEEPVPEKRWTCESQPQTWHQTTSLHVGHTAVHWSLCHGVQAFVRDEAALVFKFLLSLWVNSSRAQLGRTCVIRRNRTVDT